MRGLTWPAMRIAFVGGTRFVGHAAAALAVERGHDVAVLHRGIHPCEIAGARSIAVDRADPSALAETLARLSPEVVVDTRAMTRVDAEAGALAARIVGAPVVVVSSQDVYAQFGALNGLPSPPPEGIVTESSPLTVPYPFRGLGQPHDGGDDYDKKQVEAVYAEAVAELAAVTILRLPAVYGRRDPRRRFGALVDALDDGRRQFSCVNGARWRWTHAHVRDVAHAIVLAAERTGRGVATFNVGEAETPTMRERAEAIAAFAGATIEWEEASAVPPALSWLGALPNDLVVGSARIRADLGFTEITTQDERLADLVDGLRTSRATS